MRNRPEAKWYTPEMVTFLSGKLADSNSVFAGKLRYYRSRLTVKELKKWYPDSWLHRFLRRGKRAVFKILRLDRRER